MDLAWTLTLGQVSDRSSTLAVAGRFEFTAEVIPDPGKTAAAQSLRAVRAFLKRSRRQRDDNLGLWVFQRPAVRIARGTTGSIDDWMIASSV